MAFSGAAGLQTQLGPSAQGLLRVLWSVLFGQRMGIQDTDIFILATEMS